MYYQGSSEMEGDDGLQTLYPINPNYVAYSDHTMLFLNSTSFATSSAAIFPHAPPPPPPQPHHDPSHHDSAWGLTDQQTSSRGLSLSLSAHHQTPLITVDLDFPAKKCSSAIMVSKYLRTAQELLEEVVNVGNHRPHKPKHIKGSQITNKGTATAAASDLSTAQKQEIQMKKAKLRSMLEEVKQRCRQYEQQMQIIVAAFEQAAGRGSGGTYTHLGLNRILKQFRCLKSTISAQIKAFNKSLGEEEEQVLQGSKLKFVDQQQQQLGMMHMQSNAWRPQRGLPETAVSVLRAWLFQHFLHPYPKDSDKKMLAKQTGLTRSQVSNWFINARVRLWKPMVEEMYLEETNKQSIKPEPEPVPEILPPIVTSNFNHPLINMENLTEKNPKKSRNSNTFDNSSMEELQVAVGLGQLQGRNGFSLSLGRTHTFLSQGGGGGGRNIIDNEILHHFHSSTKPFPPPHFLPDFVT